MNKLKSIISNIRNWEFGKKLLAIIYAGFGVLIVCMIKFQELDFTGIIMTYIGLMTIATTAYYWKAKCENRIKIPIKVIKTLPKELREPLELTTIITAIIQSE